MKWLISASSSTFLAFISSNIAVVRLPMDCPVATA